MPACGLWVCCSYCYFITPEAGPDALALSPRYLDFLREELRCHWETGQLQLRRPGFNAFFVAINCCSGGVSNIYTGLSASPSRSNTPTHLAHNYSTLGTISQIHVLLLLRERLVCSPSISRYCNYNVTGWGEPGCQCPACDTY